MVAGGSVSRVPDSPAGPVRAGQTPRVNALPRIAGARPRSVVFILADDHRYDALGFMKRSFVETPNLDRIARRGVHLRNAFVTTALCSPSRATMLTGRYAHQHRVVDNNVPIPAGTAFFPQYLQQAGYQTGFFGKWHMGGESDDPQPGFDRWVSFRGQGTYLPSESGLNVDGRRVPQKGYITDELTDYTLDWLRARQKDRPFFLYLSHKGVHSEFIPPERYRGRFASKTFTPPKSQVFPPDDERRRPRWVRDQRNSWHGVDFPYHSTLDIADYFRRYAETLLGVDDSVGRVLDYLESEKLADSTLVVYMGDNGFAFGEHGLIDKRTAYEESMRVPMLMQCPELFAAGTVVDEMVANLDVAPTVLAAAGLVAPPEMVGANLVPLAQRKQANQQTTGGQQAPWRDALLYVYYWERNFPQTPTTLALRGSRFKFIRYYGLWEVDELFDLESDPLEMQNLIERPEYREMATQMSARMFELLSSTNGLSIPLNPDAGPVLNLRRPGGSRAADFPPSLVSPVPR
jgi:N-acetylglucosamine-6-sulfatase